MFFGSPIFLWLFLPLTLAAYYLVPRAWRNGVLLVASLAFYAWGEMRYVPLILGSVVFNWLMGMAIGSSHDLAGRRQWLVISVAGNLATPPVVKDPNFPAADVDNPAPSPGTP